MRKAYIREDVHIGCRLCRVYCEAEHSQSKDMIKAFKRQIPHPLPRIHMERKGEVCFAVQCRHCAEPWCVYSCFTGATYKNPLWGNRLHLRGVGFTDPQGRIQYSAPGMEYRDLIKFQEL